MKLKHLAATLTACALLCGGVAVAQTPGIPATPSLPATPATPAVPGVKLPTMPATTPTAGAAAAAATAAVPGAAAKPVLGKISINNATASELDALPGIGDKRAAAIIKGRPYKSTDELVSKKVLTHGIYNKIKDHITL